MFELGGGADDDGDDSDGNFGDVDQDFFGKIFFFGQSLWVKLFF